MAFGGATIAQLFWMVELMNLGRIPNIMILIGTNNVSRDSDEGEAQWESMMVCIFTLLWHKFKCAVLTVSTVPMSTKTLTATGRRHNGSKVLSDTEMKYGAPKAEMFAVVTFVGKYRAYLGRAPFKLRVNNRALSWLKTYSMDQSYIGRWIVRLDGYHVITEHRMRDKHQNADSFSKKTEFYERLEQKQANQAEIKEGLSFLDNETYEELPLTRWLNKSGYPIPGHPELPVEKAAWDNDSIQEGPRALGSVAAFKPSAAGNLSHEHKQPLLIG